MNLIYLIVFHSVVCYAAPVGEDISDTKSYKNVLADVISNFKNNDGKIDTGFGSKFDEMPNEIPSKYLNALQNLRSGNQININDPNEVANEPVIGDLHVENPDLDDLQNLKETETPGRLPTNDSAVLGLQKESMYDAHNSIKNIQPFDVAAEQFKFDQVETDIDDWDLHANDTKDDQDYIKAEHTNLLNLKPFNNNNEVLNDTNASDVDNVIKPSLLVTDNQNADQNLNDNILTAEAPKENINILDSSIIEDKDEIEKALNDSTVPDGGIIEEMQQEENINTERTKYKEVAAHDIINSESEYLAKPNNLPTDFNVLGSQQDIESYQSNNFIAGSLPANIQGEENIIIDAELNNEEAEEADFHIQPVNQLEVDDQSNNLIGGSLVDEIKDEENELLNENDNIMEDEKIITEYDEDVPLNVDPDENKEEVIINEDPNLAQSTDQNDAGELQEEVQNVDDVDEHKMFPEETEKNQYGSENNMEPQSSKYSEKNSDSNFPDLPLLDDDSAENSKELEQDKETHSPVMKSEDEDYEYLNEEEENEYLAGEINNTENVQKYLINNNEQGRVGEIEDQKSSHPQYDYADSSDEDDQEDQERLFESEIGYHEEEDDIPIDDGFLFKGEATTDVMATTDEIYPELTTFYSLNEQDEDVDESEYEDVDESEDEDVDESEDEDVDEDESKDVAYKKYDNGIGEEIEEEIKESSFFSFLLLSIVIVLAIFLCVRSPALFYSFILCCRTGKIAKLFPSTPKQLGYSILPMGDKSV